MGNSCTREADVVLSERGVGGAKGQRHEMARGRWSLPEYQESVDLDTLLEAPSPPAAGRRRKSRSKSKSENSRTNSRSGSFGHKTPPREGGNSKVKRDRKKPGKSSRKPFGRQMSTTHEDREGEDYRSFEDPGFMNQEMMHVDSDCILQSPFDSPTSPTVIHARWGEPADDPEEKEVCTEYRPNPFKLGFCVNCQKQHDVNENGDVAAEKEYKKIARPVVPKSAANALDNPAAVENLTPRNRESDVDLTALLQQRRDILLKLTQMEQDKARKKKMEIPSDIKQNTFESSGRHTMFVADGTTLANLRRVSANGRTGPSVPQSMRVSRTSAAMVVSPRNVSSLRGMSKSVSVGGHMDDDDEPARNDWF